MPDSKDSKIFRPDSKYGEDYYRRLTAMSDEDILEEWNTGKVNPKFRDPIQPVEGQPEQTKPERINRLFYQLQNLLPAEGWENYVNKLKGLDFNEDYEDKDGFETEGVGLFIAHAAELKIFDEKKFAQERLPLGKAWPEGKNYIYDINDKQPLYLEHLYNLKILYPSHFTAGDIGMNPKFWDGVVMSLGSMAAQEHWEAFLDAYGKAMFLNEPEIRSRLPIGERERKEILLWLKSKDRQTHVYCRDAAWVQKIWPDDPEIPIVSLADWNGCVNDLREVYARTQSPGEFIRRAVEVKYLRIEFPDEIVVG